MTIKRVNIEQEPLQWSLVIIAYIVRKFGRNLPWRNLTYVFAFYLCIKIHSYMKNHHINGPYFAPQNR